MPSGNDRRSSDGNGKRNAQRSELQSAHQTQHFGTRAAKLEARGKELERERRQWEAYGTKAAAIGCNIGGQYVTWKRVYLVLSGGLTRHGRQVVALSSADILFMERYYTDHGP